METKTSYDGLRNFQNTKQFNPVFVKDILHYSPNVTHKKRNLHIHTQNTAKFGNKFKGFWCTKIWNTLPVYIKLTTSLLEF